MTTPNVETTVGSQQIVDLVVLDRKSMSKTFATWQVTTRPGYLGNDKRFKELTQFYALNELEAPKYLEFLGLRYKIYNEQYVEMLSKHPNKFTPEVRTHTLKDYEFANDIEEIWITTMRSLTLAPDAIQFSLKSIMPLITVNTDNGNKISLPMFMRLNPALQQYIIENLEEIFKKSVPQHNQHRKNRSFLAGFGSQVPDTSNIILVEEIRKQRMRGMIKAEWSLYHGEIPEHVYCNQFVKLESTLKATLKKNNQSINVTGALNMLPFIKLQKESTPFDVKYSSIDSKLCKFKIYSEPAKRPITNDMDEFYKIYEERHLTNNPHHPAHHEKKNTYFDVKQSYEVMSDLLSCAMHQGCKTISEGLYTISKWMLDEDLKVVHKYRKLNPFGILIFYRILSENVSDKVDFTKVHKTRQWRQKPNGNHEEFLEMVRDGFTRSAYNKFIKDYDKETRIHCNMVNSLLGLAKLRQNHDADKFDWYAMVAYTWNWGKHMPSPIIATDDTDGEGAGATAMSINQTLILAAKEAMETITKTAVEFKEHIQAVSNESVAIFKEHITTASADLSKIKESAEKLSTNATQSTEVFVKFMEETGPKIDKTVGKVDTLVTDIQDTMNRFTTGTKEQIDSMTREALGAFAGVTEGLSIVNGIITSARDFIQGIGGLVRKFMIAARSALACLGVGSKGDWLGDYTDVEICEILILLVAFMKTTCPGIKIFLLYMLLKITGIWTILLKTGEDTINSVIKRVNSWFGKEEPKTDDKPKGSSDEGSAEEDHTPETTFLGALLKMFTACDKKTACAVLATLAMVFTGTMAAKKTTFNFAPQVVQAFRNTAFISMGVLAIPKLIEFFKTFLNYIAEHYRTARYGINSQTVTSNNRRVAIWLTKTIRCKNDQFTFRCMQSAEVRKKAEEIINEGYQLIAMYKQNENCYDQQLFPQICQTLRNLQPLQNLLFNFKEGSGFRPTPFSVQLSGGSRIGKSEMSGQIIDAMLKEYYGQGATSGMVYHRNTGDPYFSNYAQQPIVFMDDVFAMRDPDEMIEWIALVSCNTFPLRMASLEEKGRYFTSNAIVSTTNSPYPELADVRVLPAVWNRRHLLLEVKPKAGVKIGPAGVDWKSTAAMGTPDECSADFRHLQFAFMDPQNKDKYVTENGEQLPGEQRPTWYNFSQVKKIIAEKYAAWVNNEQARIHTKGAKMDMKDAIELERIIREYRSKTQESTAAFFDYNVAYFGKVEMRELYMQYLEAKESGIEMPSVILDSEFIKLIDESWERAHGEKEIPEETAGVEEFVAYKLGHLLISCGTYLTGKIYRKMFRMSREMANNSSTKNNDSLTYKLFGLIEFAKKEIIEPLDDEDDDSYYIRLGDFLRRGMYPPLRKIDGETELEFRERKRLAEEDGLYGNLSLTRLNDQLADLGINILTTAFPMPGNGTSYCQMFYCPYTDPEDAMAAKIIESLYRATQNIGPTKIDRELYLKYHTIMTSYFEEFENAPRITIKYTQGVVCYGASPGTMINMRTFASRKIDDAMRQARNAPSITESIPIAEFPEMSDMAILIKKYQFTVGDMQRPALGKYVDLGTLGIFGPDEANWPRCRHVLTDMLPFIFPKGVNGTLRYCFDYAAYYNATMLPSFPNYVDISRLESTPSARVKGTFKHLDKKKEIAYSINVLAELNNAQFEELLMLEKLFIGYFRKEFADSADLGENLYQSFSDAEIPIDNNVMTIIFKSKIFRGLMLIGYCLCVYYSIKHAFLFLFGSPEINPEETSKTFLANRTHRTPVYQPHIQPSSYEAPLYATDAQEHTVSVAATMTARSVPLKLYSSNFNGFATGQTIVTVKHSFLKQRCLDKEEFELQVGVGDDPDRMTTYIVKKKNIFQIGDNDLLFIRIPEMRCFKYMAPHKFYSKAEAQELMSSHETLFMCNYVNKQLMLTERANCRYVNKPKDAMETVGVVLPQYYIFDGPQAIGTSGSAVFKITKDSQTKVIGIQSLNHKSSSYVAPVYREDICAAENYFNQIGQQTIIHEGPLISTDQFETRSMINLNGDIPLIGTLAPQSVVFTMGKTQFRKTIIGSDFKTGEEPAILEFKDLRNVHKLHPLEYSVNKWSSVEMKSPPSRLIHQATIDFTMFYKSKLNNPKLRSDFTLEEVIRGCDNPLNLNTSPGLPYVLEKFNGKKPGKKEYIRYDEYGNVEYISPRVVADYDNFLEKMKLGIIPKNSNYVFPKDELRPHEKVVGPPIKTRTISVMTLPATLVYRKYNMDYETRLASGNDGTYPYSVGMSTESMTPTNMWNAMQAVGKNGFDLDVKFWDGHFPSWLFYAIRDHVAMMYGYRVGSEEYIALTSIVVNALFSYEQVEDFVIQKPNGMPSGFAGTAHYNTLGHNLLFYILYLHICETHGYIHMMNWHSFREKIAYYCYGDDLVAVVSEDVEEWLNAETFIKAYEQFGWPCTMADKTGEFCKLKPLKDLQFLKRVWMPDEFVPGQMNMLLSDATIQRLCEYYRDTADPMTQQYQNFYSFLEFSYAGGRKYYNRNFVKINRALVKKGRAPLQITFDQMASIIKSRNYSEFNGDCQFVNQNELDELFCQIYDDPIGTDAQSPPPDVSKLFSLNHVETQPFQFQEAPQLQTNAFIGDMPEELFLTLANNQHQVVMASQSSDVTTLDVLRVAFAFASLCLAFYLRFAYGGLIDSLP